MIYIILIFILIVILWLTIDFYETELKMADKNGDYWESRYKQLKCIHPTPKVKSYSEEARPIEDY